MISWILGKVKWLLLIAAVGGPVMAYLGYTGAVEKKDIMARGLEAMAVIDGGSVRKGRRSGTSYNIDLHWTDQSGKRQSADKVSISHAFADEIIKGDKLVRDQAKIKYLADAPETKPLVIEDAARQIALDEEMVPVMIGAGVLGAIGSAFLLWRSQRHSA